MQTILKIYANVFEITEEIFKGDWSCIVPVTIELKTNMLGGQKDKGHPRNINQKVQKHKYMNNHERLIFQNCQRCERFIEKIGIEHKTLENTNLGLRKRSNRYYLTGKNNLKKNLTVLRVGQVEEIDHLEEEQAEKVQENVQGAGECELSLKELMFWQP